MRRTSAIALVVIVLIDIACVKADDHTYVVNKATADILATTSYGSGDSEFVNRDIKPGAQGNTASSLPGVLLSLETDMPLQFVTILSARSCALHK